MTETMSSGVYGHDEIVGPKPSHISGFVPVVKAPRKEMVQYDWGTIAFQVVMYSDQIGVEERHLRSVCGTSDNPGIDHSIGYGDESKCIIPLTGIMPP